MDEKKFVKRIFVGILFWVVGIAAVVWWADPYFQYHEPLGNIPIILNDAVYQTAGAARNLSYDSAIVGTSMTENTRTSWLDEGLGWNTMKLSYSGAHTSDLQAIFGEMEEKQGPIKNIVMDINDFQLTSDSKNSYVVRPPYLYDGNLLDDYQYVWNLDVFKISLQRLAEGIKGTPDNVDDAYTWEEGPFFSEERVKESAVALRDFLISKREESVGRENIYAVTGETSEDFPQSLKTCQENLDNIIPFMESHPDTQFYVLIPPYSMLYWEQELLGGTLEDILAIYAYTYKALLQLDNVRVFYFQYEPEIISNLDNYRDTCHHKPEYNKYMIDCMIAGEKELTPEMVDEKIREMYEYARDYDYESIWVE